MDELWNTTNTTRKTYGHETVSSVLLAQYLAANPSLRTLAVASCITLMFLCIASNGVLVLFLNRAKTRSSSTPNQLVVMAMAAMAMVISPTGLTSSLVISLHPPLDWLFKLLENLALLAVLFSFGSNLHLVTYLQVTRYRNIVASPLIRSSHGNTSMTCAAIILYSLSSSIFGVLPKALMDAGLLSRRSLLRRIIPVAVVTFWLSLCISTLGVLTRLIIQAIRKQQRETTKVLRGQTRMVDTRPLKMNYILASLHIMIWVPYGSVVTLKPLIALRNYVFVFSYYTIFAHVSLLALPVLFYFIDKKFERFCNHALTSCRTKSREQQQRKPTLSI